MIIIKIKNSLPISNEDIHKNLLENGWKQLKEPKSITGYIILSIPFMISNLTVSQLIAGIFSSSINRTINFIGSLGLIDAIFIFLLIGIVLIVLHELIHLIFVPHFLYSDKTLIGFIIFGGYVYTEEILSKPRAVLIQIAPFMFFSVICCLVLGYLGFYNIYILLFITFNSLGSSADILGAFLILWQVPRGAKIVSNGIHTYFK